MFCLGGKAKFPWIPQFPRFPRNRAGHQFEYVFTEKTRKPSFSWTSQIFGFEKMLLFSSENIFFTNGACKFYKDKNSITHRKTIILLNQAQII